MSSQGSYPQCDVPSPSEPAIGHPVQFITGPFTGRTIRAQLTELQKADLGRKCGISDRRPLDPPPVVRLRLYEVRGAYHHEEELAEVSEAENHGFICHLDLFPVASPSDHAQQSGSRLWHIPSFAHQEDRSSPHDRSPSGRERPGQSSGSVGSGSWPGPVAAYMYGAPVLENSKCTSLVVGTTFSASSLIEYQRVKQLMFVFSDIAVKEEGEFFFRYRVFNTLYPVMGPAPLPILAEYIGGPFKVYSTKDFPGLRASTDLTKYISRFGVPVHSREYERKRRKSSHAELPGTGYHGRRELQPIALAPPAPHASTGAGSSSRHPAQRPGGTGGTSKRGRGSTL